MIVDKPAGLTSHDVVARVRRIFGTRKVGHAGTLDPMATGVLVLGLERATKLLGHLALERKAYLATIRLGASTTTDDAEGDHSVRSGWFRGRRGCHPFRCSRADRAIEQVPSSVSAVKVDGKRAYQRVRDGEEVRLPPRPVVVHRFDVLASRRVPRATELDVLVDCSSGTYVRALARDLGAGLGVGGHLTDLRRTQVGPFGLAHARDTGPVGRGRRTVADLGRGRGAGVPAAGRGAGTRGRWRTAALSAVTRDGVFRGASRAAARSVPGTDAILRSRPLHVVRPWRARTTAKPPPTRSRPRRGSTGTGRGEADPQPEVRRHPRDGAGRRLLVVLRWRGLDHLPGGWGRCVATIGVFDGVHKGHQALIGRAVELARQRELPSVVLTFDPHPSEVVRPGQHPAQLTSLNRKAKLVEELGVDVFCVLPFTPELSRVPADEFVHELLVDRLHVAEVVVGQNFTFGHMALGDVTLLRSLGHRFGFTTEGADLVTVPDGAGRRGHGVLLDLHPGVHRRR